MDKKCFCQGCILVLCGLPGSGKTSLTTEIRKRLVKHRKSSDESIQVVTVTYDKILSSDLEQRLVEKEKFHVQSDGNDRNQVVSAWKNFRNGIVMCVDSLLQSLQSEKIPSKPDMLDDTVWDMFTVYIDSEGILTSLRPQSTVVIVIDDNMYYSSMRYQYFQLARKYQLGFCQVHVTCDVQESASRNAQRKESVPAHVIIDMAEKFEPPDAEQNKWEHYSLSVNSGQSIEMSKIIHLIHEAVENPVHPVEAVDPSVKEESRVGCSQSVLHQVDQILRKIVTDTIQEVKGTMQKDQLKCYAKHMNATKNQLLQHFKTGTRSLPEDVLIHVTDASKSKSNALYIFIQESFQNQLIKRQITCS